MRSRWLDVAQVRFIVFIDRDGVQVGNENEERKNGSNTFVHVKGVRNSSAASLQGVLQDNLVLLTGLIFELATVKRFES